jgi:hypothetical protein
MILDYCDLQTLWENRAFFKDPYLERRISKTPFSIVMFCDYIDGPYACPYVECQLVVGQSKPKETDLNDSCDISKIDPLYDVPRRFAERMIWSTGAVPDSSHSLLWRILNMTYRRLLWVKWESDENEYCIPRLLGIGEEMMPWWHENSSTDCIDLYIIKWGEQVDSPLYLEVPKLPETFKILD